MPVQPLPCEPGGPGPGPGGSCCSPSTAAAPVCLEDGTPILLIVRSPCVCDGAPAGDPEVVGWIDPATGAFTPGGAPAGAGPCGAPECPSTTTVLRLCDLTAAECVPFLRRLVLDCDGQITATVDTDLDGVTPYTPAGTVADCEQCEQCEPTPMCPALLGLSGPETWEMPDGVESLSLSVACGPVTVTDCAGNTTQINECGTSFNWAAPGGDCRPGVLCTPVTITLPEGAAVYLNFLAPCDLGDES